MRLKLDENLGASHAALLRSAGHDVATVLEQGLCSAPDPKLIGICRDEGRCLVTLDLDFANPLRFHSEVPGASFRRWSGGWGRNSPAYPIGRCCAKVFYMHLVLLT